MRRMVLGRVMVLLVSNLGWSLRLTSLCLVVSSVLFVEESLVVENLLILS